MSGNVKLLFALKKNKLFWAADLSLSTQAK